MNWTAAVNRIVLGSLCAFRSERHLNVSQHESKCLHRKRHRVDSTGLRSRVAENFYCMQMPGLEEEVKTLSAMIMRHQFLREMHFVTFN